jgi:hypothetical protein
MPSKLRRKTWTFDSLFSYQGRGTCQPGGISDAAQTESHNEQEDIEFESIEYDAASRARYNECEHQRWIMRLLDNPPLVVQVHSGFSPQAYCYLSKPAHFLIRQNMPNKDTRKFGYNLFNADWNLFYNSWDVKALKNKAIRHLRSAVEVKRHISILNFMYELKDLKRLIDPWRDNVKFLDRLASGKLSYKYGAAPFLGDVVSLLQSLGKIRKRMKFHLREAGKIRVLKGRMDSDVWQIRSTDQYHIWTQPVTCYDGLDVNGFNYSTASYMIPEEPPVRYAIKYSFGLPQLSELQFKLRYLCESFGLAWDPQIIWDGIKFTFVVDWFFAVGDWLHDHFAVQPIPITLRIHESCVSTKCIQNTTAHADVRSGDVVSANPTTEPVTVLWRGTRYSRQRLDLSLDDISYAGWSKSVFEKILTGAALVFTTRDRRKQFKLPRRVPSVKRTLGRIESGFEEFSSVTRRLWRERLTKALSSNE